VVVVADGAGGRGYYYYYYYYLQAKDALVNFSVSVFDLCKNPAVAFVVGLQIVYSFVQNSMSYRHILNYLEDRFKIETYQYGFISSYSAVAGILADVFLVPLFSKLFKTQHRPFGTMSLCILLMAVAALMEVSSADIHDYVWMSMLPTVLLGNLVSSSMKNAFLSVIPQADTGKAQGVMGILQSLSGVVAPIYGTAIMSYAGSGSPLSALLSVELSRPHFAAAHLGIVALVAAVGGIRVAVMKPRTKCAKKD
jgi:hypothetical protein